MEHIRIVNPYEFIEEKSARELYEINFFGSVEQILTIMCPYIHYERKKEDCKVVPAQVIIEQESYQSAEEKEAGMNHLLQEFNQWYSLEDLINLLEAIINWYNRQSKLLASLKEVNEAVKKLNEELQGILTGVEKDEN